MAATASPRKAHYGNGTLVLDYYLAGDVDAGTLQEWIVPHNMRIVDVIAHATDAGGSGSSILDVEVEGNSIFTATGDRPTLPGDETGYFTMAGFPGGARVNAGDVVALLCDTEATTEEHTGLVASIVLEGR